MNTTAIRSFSLISRFCISCLTEVDDVCRESRNLLLQCRQNDHVFAVDLLLREFLNNAIIDGNCSDTCKSVQVTVQIGRKWIKLCISDEGSGFNWRYRRICLPDEEAISGRGLLIGTLYADRMQHNRKGNQVTLWIRKK
jgi:anti-sigma regulatory factor (Ser/Thr protein kinase)